METKKCSKCGEVKTLDDFREGRTACWVCLKKERNNWYHKGGGKEKYSKIYNRKNTEIRKTYNKKKLIWFKENWKELSPINKYIDSYGYVVLHFGFGVRYREHCFEMAKKIGRLLLPHEEVHHINGDKKNNKISNLELIGMRGHSTKLYKLAKTIAQQDQEIARLKELLAQKEVYIGSRPQQ